ncbi:MAG: hypothetical protein AB7P76_11770 [Candidatus Melainabacteria bacterium]
MSFVSKSAAAMMTALLLAGGVATAQQTLPPHVAGKVVAVSHEKVKVNEAWLDQIKVKVDSCRQPGKIEEVIYSPARVSDTTALGHLFDADLQHAWAVMMDKAPPQRQINGIGVFWVDANNHVQRTGLLGNDVDCSRVPALLGQFQ